MQEIFQRIEEKYILNREQKDKLLELIKDHLKDDEYGPSTVCNIYYDNMNKDLVRTSMDKPFYKEKVRLRSYNTPGKDSTAFLEIKEGKSIDCNKQIVNEIDYCFKYYKLQPSLFLSYDRVAYYDKDDSSFRLTFDTNITARDYDLDLSKGVYGKKYCDSNTFIMEIKCAGGLPFWFLRALQEVKAYPGSFSKYGKVYEANYFKKAMAF